MRSRPDRFRREQSAGSKLPYARHVNDRTLELRDGSLMQVVRLGGLLFETADTDEINYRKLLRDSTLRAVGSSRFAVYHHIIRRRTEPETAGIFADGFSQQLDDIWRARLSSRKLYANELFMTIVRRPMQGRFGAFDRLLATRLSRGSIAASGGARLAAECKALDAAVEQMLAAMAIYSPNVLAVYETPNGRFSEPLEFISALYNAEFRPVRMPYCDAGEYVPYRRASFGQDMVELGPAGQTGRSFGAMISVKDYPGETSPGLLDNLLRLPIDLVVSQSFAFVDRQEGLARMNLALRRMRASDDEARSLRSELELAKDEFAAGRAAFGEHHMTVLVRSETIEDVNSGAAEVQAALTDLGMIAVREDVGMEAAYWAQFPGNFPFIARRALISSANFASFASAHNFALGQPSGNFWGDAVTVFETTAAGPYHFNFHHGDLGNFTVIGPSGSGKTVIVNFLLAQARRYNPRIIFFDKDRGAELFIRAVGGVYDVLRPGVPSRLNPLQLPETPENERFLIEWVTRLVCHDGQGITPEEQQQIKEAVDSNFVAPKAYRRLGTFVELFRGGHRPHTQDLFARLRPWWGEGEHAWLFDNAEDQVDLSSQTVGFDMTRLLDDATVRTPAMMYLFHRVDERLDGNPAIIVVDEGWKALDDEVFIQRIRDWEKTIRKRNGIVGFVTQNAEDALDSQIAGTIIEQAATQIFTANSKAKAEHYVNGFGLTEHEYELVRNLPDTSHCFLVKHGRDSIVVRLNLSGEAEILTILSARERTVRMLDEIRTRTGDDPADWLPELIRVA